MRRRDFIALAGIAVEQLAWPQTASAQQRVRLIGALMSSTPSDADSPPRIAAFETALKDLGWVEGRNLKINYIWPGAGRDRIRSAAKELVRLAPDVILATNTPALAAAREETRELPVVFLNVTDPVGQGFVSSLAKPGGNITGFTSFEFSMGGKWMEILKEVAPKIVRLGLIYNPVTAPYVEFYIRSFRATEHKFAFELIPTPVHDADEIERAITEFAHQPNGGLFVAPDVTTAMNQNLIVSLTKKHQLPSIYAYRYWIRAGGLISYGVDIVDFYRRAANYMDRIFKGDDPGGLPVQQPVKFELVINLKTARALGITVPPTLLAQADEVIE